MGDHNDKAAKAAAIEQAHDPRPRIVSSADSSNVLGFRCTSCGYAGIDQLTRCPVCAGPSVSAEFGPGGTVFAATVLRVPVPGRTPPYGLAYVDIDDGPRLLAHVAEADTALAPGTRVVLSGCTEQGDPLVRLENAS